jgi:hypothetical protein
MKKHEEQIGVRLPDGRRYMATVLAGALETDEELLVRMTKEVGTIFNVNAQKLLVTSLNPFRLKNITEVTEEEDEPKPSRRPERMTLPPAPVVISPPVEVRPPIETAVDPPAETVEAAPKSERRSTTSGPAVGERWRPKDPRRIASFTVKEIQGDVVLTDDGRSIALNRFSRYVRVDENLSAKSNG